MKVIKELLDSKKFMASLLGVITAVLTKLGIPEIEVQEVVAILSPVLVYIGAQGAADLGKEAAAKKTETEK